MQIHSDNVCRGRGRCGCWPRTATIATTCSGPLWACGSRAIDACGLLFSAEFKFALSSLSKRASSSDPLVRSNKATKRSPKGSHAMTSKRQSLFFGDASVPGESARYREACGDGCALSTPGQGAPRVIRGPVVRKCSARLERALISAGEV